MVKLDAVRAVVTGAAGGLGRIFCRRLLEAGASVVGTDFDSNQLIKTEKELESAILPGRTYKTLAGSVSSEDDVANIFTKARELMGGCNVLVNNAGILRDATLVKRDKATGRAVKNLSKRDWDAVIDVNLTGPYLCTREFAAQAMGVEKQAVVVNISSLARLGNFGQTNYTAAKAGLAADTVVWSKELAPHGIRVGCIAPGVIQTQMIESIPARALEALLEKIPLRRTGQPDEIWAGIRFIIECDYFTGRVLEIDGGMTGF